MSDEIEKLLTLTQAGAALARHRPPVGMVSRLRLVAALLRDASSAHLDTPASAKRLLWRDHLNKVRVIDVGEKLAIGRHADCDIVLLGQRVSRHHCAISLHGASAVLSDLGSTNGTRVNGRPIMALTCLDDGDLIQVGGYFLAYFSS